MGIIVVFWGKQSRLIGDKLPVLALSLFGHLEIRKQGKCPEIARFSYHYSPWDPRTRSACIKLPSSLPKNVFVLPNLMMSM